jgi:3-phenylpropionate/trans-cinnamate dioxygenase ferredoxin component
VSAEDVGALNDFPDGEATPRRVAGRALVVVRIGDRVYILDDRCSHEEFPLSVGEVDAERCEIECERHGSMFDLRDGAPLSFPATKPVPTYDTRIEDGRVMVELS